MMLFTSYLSCEVLRILRFGLVGAAGFVMDAALLLLILEGSSINPLAARFVSAPTAILLTFALNRHWSFADLNQKTILRSLLSYIMVQGFGLLVNLGLYWALLSIAAPVLALAVASVAVMAINYLGSRYWAFVVRR